MFFPVSGISLRSKWFRLFRAGWCLPGRFAASTPSTQPAQPAQPTPFLVQWLRNQPPEHHIFITVDSASGEMVLLEAFPKDKLPDLLALALERSPESDWQPRLDNSLLRRDFEPAKLLDKKQDALAALEAIVSCRLAALSEMRGIDQETLQELAKLGVYFRDENLPPPPLARILQVHRPQ